MKIASERCMRILLPFAACALCFAQTPAPAPPATAAASGSNSSIGPEGQPLRIEVRTVIAPTTVLDKDGRFVAGLRADDFTLYDNGKSQRLTEDISYHPISMVVCVQASSMLEDILPKVQKIGNVLDSLVLGDNGEAAVVAFDHRIRVMQDFTSDSGKISAALEKIHSGSSSHRLNDTVLQAIQMLKSRPNDHRKVILLISETRDGSSEARVREVLNEAQFANVVIYTIDISHLMKELTGEPMTPRPDPIPATAQHVPAGAAQAPGTMLSNTNPGNAIPLFVEIFKATKGLFVDSPATVYTRFTGGKQYYFISQRNLEDAVSKLGEELHSQYLLSYRPNNMNEGGYHEIKVIVNRPDLDVRTRPGYWIAAQSE